MNFKEHLIDYEGLLDWEAHFRLRSGAIILCRCDEEYKTELTCLNDYVRVDHLKKKDDGYLHPLRADYIPLDSIDCFQITYGTDDEPNPYMDNPNSDYQIGRGIKEWMIVIG